MFELRPNVDWHKGKAVMHLMQKLGASVPVYLGDDATDEDAFAELEAVADSVTVLVADRQQVTKAKFRVSSVAEVLQLFELLAADN